MISCSKLDSIGRRLIETGSSQWGVLPSTGRLSISSSRTASALWRSRWSMNSTESHCSGLCSTMRLNKWCRLRPRNARQVTDELLSVARSSASRSMKAWHISKGTKMCRCGLWRRSLEPEMQTVVVQMFIATLVARGIATFYNRLGKRWSARCGGALNQSSTLLGTVFPYPPKFRTLQVLDSDR